MNKLLSELIIFSAPDENSTVGMMGDFFGRLNGGMSESEGLKTGAPASGILRHAMEEAAAYGFEGDLWHSCVARYIAMNENPYSLGRERDAGNRPSGTAARLAREDCGVLRRIFNFDFSGIGKSEGAECFAALKNFEGQRRNRSDAGRVIEALKKGLEGAGTDDEFFDVIDGFYSQNGPGLFGLNKAFTLGERNVLKPVKALEDVRLSDLIGYEVQKKKLTDNTEAFLLGKPANNVLLYGDSGTGKSTSVRAIANQYFGRGLRLIQVYRHQMQYLSAVIDDIKNRNYRFIIYMDDLSFEDFETEYKYLKAVIEGGLEQRPENVLIYATSNRRHLIKETWKDRTDVEHDGDIHRSDSIEEKLSLAERFGVQIYYGKPNNDEYHGIVRELAARENVNMSEEELHAEATKWEISHGGISGRSARQLIDYLKGTEENDR